MKKLTKEQKKLIYIASIAALLLLIFWIFIYLPQARRLSLIKKRLMDVEKEIEQVDRITGGRELKEVMQGFNSRLNEIFSKMPPRFDDVVDDLSEEARKLGIEVKDINFLSKKVLKDKVPGYELEELPMVMNLVCEYNALGDYLNLLRTRFPVVVKIGQLDIKGAGAGNPKLDAALRISAYLAREISAK